MGTPSPLISRPNIGYHLSTVLAPRLEFYSVDPAVGFEILDFTLLDTFLKVGVETTKVMLKCESRTPGVPGSEITYINEAGAPGQGSEVRCVAGRYGYDVGSGELGKCSLELEKRVMYQAGVTVPVAIDNIRVCVGNVGCGLLPLGLDSSY